MKKTLNKRVLERIPWIVIAIVLFAIISVVITVVVQNQSEQTEKAEPSRVVFQGEYRIAGGEWQSLENAGLLSATKGNVELKGAFWLCDNQSGEKVSPLEKGTFVYFYLDHVKAIVKDAHGNVWFSNNENDQNEKGSCAESWEPYELSGESGEEISITFYNPHVFGNEKAIDGFLDNLQIYYGENSSVPFSGRENLRIVIEILILVFFFVLLAAAVCVSLMRIKHSREVWLAWLLVFFGEIYFIFSAEKIGIWSNSYVFNTMTRGISMMLYLFVAAVIAVIFLHGRARKIATAATALLGITTVISVIASATPSVKFYDVYPYWTPVAVGVIIAVIACLVAGFVGRGADGALQLSKNVKKYVYIPLLAMLFAFVVDAGATFFGIWQGGVLSVFVFLLVILLSVIVVARVIPRNIRTAIDAKELEAEKQAMEMKLQESHISIMLSQIQPHFLYNTLNSIYQLCETNPMLARSMVNSFSEYLRNNLSSLDEPGLISFETELAHIKTYLDIEKIRFDDTLEIEYDIECVDFMLPVLTVQPIVENAVKHGTSKKRGGGKVCISTREDGENYVITVSDTGCGFDTTKEKHDGKRHVGIVNVRQRLSNMCKGVLIIESTPGAGTVATIKIPKGGKE